MKKVFSKIDKPLFILMFISLIFGVMMVGSASSLKAYMAKADSYFYFKRQLLFIGAGLFAGYIVINTPLKRWKKLVYLGSIGIAGLLVYVLISEKVMNGVSGWLFIGGFGIQPSEFAKTILILFLAFVFDN